MTVRLSNKVREEVIASVIASKIEKKVKVVIKAMNDYVENYKRYSPATQDWIDAAPKNALVALTSFHICMKSGNGNNMPFKHKMCDSYYDRNIAKSSRFGYKPPIQFTSKKSIRILGSEHRADIVFTAKKDVKMFESSIKKLDALRELEVKTSATLRQALYGCSTMKQINDNYPELVKYFPIPESSCKALMIPNDKVLAALKDLA